MKTKEFKCPFCELKFEKRDLIEHIGDKHDDLIPKNYSAFRVTYDHINCKPAGYNGSKCVICNSKLGNWNENKGLYNRVCSNKACKEEYVKRFMNNNQFTSAEGQADLLSKRKISGTYKMSDGIEKTYTGSYEKKCLEFMDKVLHVNSEDLLAPGISVEYEYENKKHIYLSDFFYIPYNLIIEVKDGGDNPKRKDMIDYRKKTIAKEKWIIKNTNFSYIRLTDNDLSQLMSIFFELKLISLDGTDKKRIIRINE